jgi:hypothetical protein
MKTRPILGAIIAAAGLLALAACDAAVQPPPRSETATPSITAVGSPSSATSVAPTPIPDAVAEQLALQMYSGGGSASTGYSDCLTLAATCPVTPRLRDRFQAFAGSRKPTNAGAGSTDPVCRGCQAAFPAVTVVSATTSASGATVIVALGSGDAVDLAVTETVVGSTPLVDDILCVSNGQPEPQSSLYLVSTPTC